LESSLGCLLCGKCLVSSSVTLIEGCGTGPNSPVWGAAGCSPGAGAEKTGCGLIGELVCRIGGPGFTSYCACGAAVDTPCVVAPPKGREATIFEIPTARRMNPTYVQNPNGEPPRNGEKIKLKKFNATIPPPIMLSRTPFAISCCFSISTGWIIGGA